jgi:gliding motility associated protien GldN|tara:strand:+ start:944 stop:1834 length:891 start_codon:yes stop_codon:yes gene_type:complete
MFKKCTLLFSAILLTSSINAQINILNAKEVDEIGQIGNDQMAENIDVPIPYGYIDDRDVLWSKVVWEVIDLNQKINLPYYFPTDTTNVSHNRRSLWDNLVTGLKGGVFEAYPDSFFSSAYPEKELEDKVFTYYYTPPSGGDKEKIEIASKDIFAYKIKGMWYFDKRQGELKYRLLGLSPMTKDNASNMSIAIDQSTGKPVAEESDVLFPLFWVFYPAVRQVLHNAKVFNPKNSMQPISFDHLLNARRFSAVIVKEENIYDNRKIEDYVRGNSLFQLLEADRIKESIRNREMDMWSY